MSYNKQQPDGAETGLFPFETQQSTIIPGSYTTCVNDECCEFLFHLIKCSHPNSSESVGLLSSFTFSSKSELKILKLHKISCL